MIASETFAGGSTWTNNPRAASGVSPLSKEATAAGRLPPFFLPTTKRLQISRAPSVIRIAARLAPKMAPLRAATAPRGQISRERAREGKGGGVRGEGRGGASRR